MSSIGLQEAKQIAEDAYILAVSMLENFKMMYVMTVNENLPTFQAPSKRINEMTIWK